MSYELCAGGDFPVLRILKWACKNKRVGDKDAHSFIKIFLKSQYFFTLL
jgi:hypothetical protein